MTLRSAAVATVACLSALYASCFSERTSGPGSELGAVCNVPVSELLQSGEYIPIRGFAFLIDTLRVARGTRVSWVNCEAAGADPHTVTSDAGVWASPSIPVGATFSRTFDVRGTFPYHCIPHPTMRAVVIVE